MKKYFDKENNRLIFNQQAASPTYWDEHWDMENFPESVKKGGRNRLIMSITKRYLPPQKNKKILEGGCGKGQLVYAFKELGYDAYGIDYAKRTVDKTNKLFPELKISFGDVRKTEFPDNFFDGYWSIGVIEHFFEGYASVIREMERIIKPGGFLFVAFPHFSLLRKLKVKLGLYPLFDANRNREDFYEFVYDCGDVINEIEKYNFVNYKKIIYGGTKGLKDEVSFFHPLLQKIYDSNNIFLRILNYGSSVILSKFSSHSALLIFRKK